MVHTVVIVSSFHQSHQQQCLCVLCVVPGFWFCEEKKKKRREKRTRSRSSGRFVVAEVLGVGVARRGDKVKGFADGTEGFVVMHVVMQGLVTRGNGEGSSTGRHDKQQEDSEDDEGCERRRSREVLSPKGLSFAWCPWFSPRGGRVLGKVMWKVFWREATAYSSRQCVRLK